MLKNSIAKKTLKFWFSSALLCIWMAAAVGQTQRAQHWAFPNNNALDFGSGSPAVGTTPLSGERGTSAISDEDGNLIFYSNGQTVHEANGNIMGGGGGLVGDSTATQSSIIIPATISNTRFYLFTNDAATGPDGLNYYDVEMTLNGGNGGVVGPTPLLDTATEKLAATRSADDRGYWVVAHRWESDDFCAFKVDQNGVTSTPVVSSVGIAHLNSAGSGEETGQMKISPDGKWLATCNFSSGYVQLFPFNNATGVVSEPITLASGLSVKPWGVEFSADSKKIFYAQRVSSGSNPARIYQFDLDHASVDCLLASEVSITNSNPFKLYEDLQLAPDKNIYIAYYKPAPFSADTLGMIDHPELMCPDCDYTDNELLLSSSMFSGLTNFVSSFLSDGIRYEFGTNCEDDSTVFWPEDTLDLDSVRWNFGDPSTGSANTSTGIPAYHVFSNAPDTFNVTLYAYRGTQIDTFNRDVILWDTAVDLLGPDTTLCTGQSITLDATWYDACVIWDDSSTNLTYTTNQEGWHGVEVSHQSCVWRDSVFVTLVTQPPQFTLGNDTSVCADVNFVIDPDLQNAFYTWQDGSHDTTYTVNSTGTYWLEASNACGTSTDTLNVILNEAAQPILEFPDDTTICDTVGLTLDVTFEGAVYEWNDGSNLGIRTINDEGTYWVRVGNACDTVSDTIQISVDDAMFSALEERMVFCEDRANDTVLILATPDSQQVNWLNVAESAVLALSGGGATVWFSDSNACGTLTDTVEVVGYDSDYVFFVGSDSVLCSPQERVLLGDTLDDYPWEYDWNTGSDAPFIEVGLGFYQLTASHRCDTVVHTAAISRAPRIAIEDSLLENVCSDDTVLLNLTSRSFRSVDWSTGDTTYSTPVDEPGTYTMFVIDTFDCPHSDTLQLGDFCPGVVFVPNVFTPSNDGINDEFCIELENIVSFEFQIYNRWGVEMFYSQNEGHCWDGEVNGTAAPAGAYYYRVVTTDGTDKTSAYRGSFTLIRE